MMLERAPLGRDAVPEARSRRNACASSMPWPLPAHAKAQHYAEWAVRETGMGVVEHKRIKNEACSKGLVATYAGGRLRGAAHRRGQEDRRAAAPGRRDLCPDPGDQSGRHRLLQDDPRADDAQRDHPQPASGAKACSADAARTLAEAAKAAGAPDGVIQVLEEPSIPLIEKIIADERIDLIVATADRRSSRRPIAPAIRRWGSVPATRPCWSTTAPTSSSRPSASSRRSRSTIPSFAPMNPRCWRSRSIADPLLAAYEGRRRAYLHAGADHDAAPAAVHRALASTPP